MRIHHLNCGTLCPLARRLINGDGGLFERGHMVCHCLLIEGPQGLILVDTGLGMQDITHGLPRLFEALTAPQLTPAGTALAQVQALGFSADDVRDIIVTHLDLDHAGGLADFPKARVHLHGRELRAAQAGQGMDAHRYLKRQWAHGPAWQAYDATDGEPWFGLHAVRALTGLPPEILLVPLPGHSKGHTGVAVHGDDGWVLHGGDAWFSHLDLVTPRRTPVGLKLFQWLAGDHTRQRRASLAQVQALAARAGDDVQLICAHDPADLARCTGH